jgi:YebC/PmpR family DNA-binding regulatory protein
MAGHSKSSNIKHRKNTQDAKRSRLFTKIVREITVAARENPDIVHNPRLRLARDRAFRAGMSKDTFEKAIKKVTEPTNVFMEAIRYEGYGPSGTAFLVDTFTDNRNRTASDVRYTLTRHGGSLGATGSVAWLFHEKGLIQLTHASFSESELMELALETGAEDIIFSAANAFPPKLITSTETLASVVQSLEAQSVAIEEAAPTWIPINRTLIEDLNLLEQIQHCLEALEALPDVEAIYVSCGWQLA